MTWSALNCSVKLIKVRQSTLPFRDISYLHAESWISESMEINLIYSTDNNTLVERFYWCLWPEMLCFRDKAVRCGKQRPLRAYITRMNLSFLRMHMQIAIFLLLLRSVYYELPVEILGTVGVEWNFEINRKESVARSAPIS